MKKKLLFGFLILFVLSTTAFAGMNDPKKESEKPAVTTPRETKLSDEETSRLSRRAEIDNLAKLSFSDKEKIDSKNNLKASKQVIVGERHGGYIWYGGGTLLLIIILVIILV